MGSPDEANDAVAWRSLGRGAYSIRSKGTVSYTGHSTWRRSSRSRVVQVRVLTVARPRTHSPLFSELRFWAFFFCLPIYQHLENTRHSSPYPHPSTALRLTKARGGGPGGCALLGLPTHFAFASLPYSIHGPRLLFWRIRQVLIRAGDDNPQNSVRNWQVDDDFNSQFLLSTPVYPCILYYTTHTRG